MGSVLISSPGRLCTTPWHKQRQQGAGEFRVRSPDSLCSARALRMHVMAHLCF